MQNLFSVVSLVSFIFTCTSSFADVAENVKQITCGDHWFKMTVDVSWPESRVQFSGDSNPIPSDATASTLITDLSDRDGNVTHHYHFQLLNGLDGNLDLTSQDKKTASGIMKHPSWTSSTNVTCTIEHWTLND